MLTGFGEMLEAAGEKPWGVDLVLGKPVTTAGLRASFARASPSEYAENPSETAALQRPMSFGHEAKPAKPFLLSWARFPDTGLAVAYGSHLPMIAGGSCTLTRTCAARCRLTAGTR
jgi:hypothetical protein